MFPGSALLWLVLANQGLTATQAAVASEEALQREEALYASPTQRDQIGRIIAPVTVNGQGPFRFVVDTGATHSALSEQLVQRLGLAVDQDVKVRLRGVTGSALIATARVERLQAGDLVIENASLPVLASAWSGADGVLGMQGLDDKVIVVDFKRDRIQILESSRKLWRDLIRVPVRFGFERLLLADGRVGRVPVKAIIDTGAQHTLGNRALREALLIDDSRLPTHISVHGVTTELQTGELAAAPYIRLGSMNLTRVNIAFGDMHVFEIWKLADEPALLLGMDVLGVLEMLVIDYRRREVLFKPRSDGITLRKR